MSFRTSEIMDHYHQSVHRMSTNDKKKRGSVPLAMMERNVKRFSGEDGKVKLAKAARISATVIRRFKS